MTRVHSAVAELDYKPRGRAQNHGPRGANLIGYFVSDIANPLYGPSVAAAEQRLYQAGYKLLVASTHHDIRRETELLSMLEGGIVAGALLAFGEESHSGLGAALRRMGTPTVIIDRELPPGIDGVLVDHHGGTLAATRYLIGLGHRRIALLTAAGNIRPALGRISGMEEAFVEAGLPLDGMLVRKECSSAGVAFSEMMDLIDGAEPPTAALVLGNQALGGVMKAIKSRNIAVPDQMSLIAIGDTDIPQIIEPALTAIKWDIAEVGRTAVDLLIQRISGRLTSAQRRTQIATELILRNSCARPPGR